MAPFVIYANFESILEPFGRYVRHTTNTQQHNKCLAAPIHTSSFYNYDKWTVMNVKSNSLAEFLYLLIVWEAEIVASLQTNRALKRLSARPQDE